MHYSKYDVLSFFQNEPQTGLLGVPTLMRWGS